MRLDEITTAMLAAATTPADRVAAVRNSLGTDLTVELRNGADVIYSGTFVGPLVAGPQSLTANSPLVGAVTQGGTPDSGTWTCRIRNESGRWLEAPFGPSGQFQFSDEQLAVGSTMRLNVSILALSHTVTVHDNFERNNIDSVLSEVITDTDGETLIRLKVRPSRTSVAVDRWLTAHGKVSGVRGLRPRFELFDYAQVEGTWRASNRPLFSADGGLTWTPFAAVESYTGQCKFRHDEPFSADEILISEYWPETISGFGNRIAAWAAAHPTKVKRTPTAQAHTTALTTWPAPPFIAADIGATSDSAGRIVPPTPLYGFMIDDDAYGQKAHNIVLIGGQHGGEDDGQLPLWQIIDAVLADTAAGQAVRQKYRFVVYPMVNTQGRWYGHLRGMPGTLTDPNREWNKVNPVECVAKTRAAILADTGGSAVLAADFHSTNGFSSVTRWTMSARDQFPLSVALLSEMNARLGAYGEYVGNYGIQSEVINPQVSLTARGWFVRDLGASLPLTFEVNQIGPPVGLTTFSTMAICFVESLAALEVA